MSSRKNRLSLSSDARKDAGGKTSCRTPTSATLGTKNSDTRSNEESYDISPSQGSEYSPVISLTQDNAFHAINGVSWKWNSPQRFHGQVRMKATDAKRLSHKQLWKQNRADCPVDVPKEATGFNKFISKLNLLMGKENVNDGDLGGGSVDMLEVIHSPTDVVAERTQSEEQADSEDNDDPFKQYFIESDDEKCDPPQVDHIENPAIESSEGFNEQLIDDELDDSKLDRMLIEVSQTVENRFINPSLPPPAAIPKKVESHAAIPFEMNDSDMDGFLVQASLMVEEKLSDSSQESTSHKPGASINPHAGVPSVSSRHTNTIRCAEVENKPPKPVVVHVPEEDSAAGTSEITMSQEELKALLEKKRQEALLRLQNNRLKRAMKGTSSNG